MHALEPTGPNAEQIKYWNETAGPKWAALQDLIETQIAPLGRLAMDAAAIVSGDRVLDVGCGCGETSIELGRRVEHGSVTGIDISTVMLERARASARAASVSNVRFENADAQTHTLPPGAFDLAYSRFGVMFFADPHAAFANLLKALRPGGRLTFICWQPLHDNPWMYVPLLAAAQHVPMPPPPAPDAPGPFSFGDAARVGDIMSRAGFADVQFRDITETLTIGGMAGLDAAVEFLLQMGPTGAALREQPAENRQRVTTAVREALAPYDTDQGVRMQAAARIVSARKAD